jgi:hypothetical protein
MKRPIFRGGAIPCWIVCWTAVLAKVACASNVPAAQPGTETGQCIDGECLGGLVCLSNVCVDPSESDTETDTNDSTVPTSTTGTTTVGTTSTTTDGTTGVDTGEPPMPTTRQVSVLFVIDNSGSMGEEQANLVAALDPFLGALTDVDLRIAVTTTDNGNPWCQGTGPEGGRFVASQCRSRLSDFIFQGPTEVDATTACTDYCPASLDGWSGPASPWYERQADGTTNVGNIEFADAVRCGLPQGINGCGFEQQLESMYKALARADAPQEAEFGFVDPGGLVAVILVTDEVDCSTDNEADTIFLPDGDRTFWSMPEGQASPTSAVCWNAGVECSGGPGTYDECHSVSLDALGNAVPDDEGVMRPLPRYTERLADSGAIAYGIVGVPSGGAAIVYRDAPGGTPNDPNFQVNFGIGPGCTSTVAEAVPPVRLRELVEGSPASAGALYSVCDLDWSSTLAAIATDILAWLPPA